MDYDAYIDIISTQLQVNSFNAEELKIIEGCFERDWEIEIAIDLIQTSWAKEEHSEDYNTFGTYD